METRFTKGEWTYNKTTHKIKPTLENTGIDVICEMWGYVTEQGEANAKLIATAPKMIELICQAEAWLSFNPTPSGEEIKEFKKSLSDIIKIATE